MKLPRTLDLPVFPWDLLLPFEETASKHIDGLVDLSVGTPVDDTPENLQAAFCASSNAPGYPTVLGAKAARQAITDWANRRRRASNLQIDECFPTIGSKELVANLGWQLGIKPGDKVLFPDVAYPTYDICARLAGAQSVPVNNDIDSWPTDAALVWINTPSNPSGWVASEKWLKQVVTWAREHQVVVVSDECYAELNWEIDWVPSLISDCVCGGDYRNLLMVYSLSKQSNLAGYRAAFVAGDEQLINALVAVRKHAGFMAPAPVQAALATALNDDSHVARQREVYRRRREALLEATTAIGLQNHPESRAGLYLWLKKTPATNPDFLQLTESLGSGQGADWELVAAFAKHGILVAPESFYSPHPEGYIRLALTASDEKISQAVARLEKISV